MVNQTKFMYGIYGYDLEGILESFFDDIYANWCLLVSEDYKISETLKKLFDFLESKNIEPIYFNLSNMRVLLPLNKTIFLITISQSLKAVSLVLHYIWFEKSHKVYKKKGENQKFLKYRLRDYTYNLLRYGGE